MQVDDKYQYSAENRENKVHGWICSNPATGFWMITPSSEFRVGGPLKQDLTSHAGPVTLSVSAFAISSREKILDCKSKVCYRSISIPPLLIVQ